MTFESKEYIIEGKTTAYKVRLSVYKEGTLQGKIMVGISRLGPFFWDCFEHDIVSQQHVDLVESLFEEYCRKADALAKEGRE